MRTIRKGLVVAAGLLALPMTACWGPQQATQPSARRPQAKAGPAKPPAFGLPLEGLVRLPASVVAAHPGSFSAQGGGILSNNGGSLVGAAGGGILSNHGAGWRLLQQVEALPLVSAKVHLLAADGQALLGPDGKALEASTDAEGRFRFPQSPKGQAYLVAVALPPSVGPMAALVPKPLSEAPTPLRVDAGSTALVAYLLDELLPAGAGAQAGLDAIAVGQAVAFQDALSAALAQQAPLGGFLKPELKPKLAAAEQQAAVASAAEALKGAVQGAVAATALAPSPGPAPATPSASRAPTPTPVPSGSPWPVASYSDNLAVLVAFRWAQGQGLAFDGVRAERAQVSAEGYQPINTDSAPYEVDADRLGCRVWVPFPKGFSGSIPYRLTLGAKNELRFTLPSVVMQVGTLKSDAVTQPAGVSFSATARHQVQVQVQGATVANTPLSGLQVTLQNALVAGSDGTPVPPATTDAQGKASFGPLLLPLSLSYSLRQGARTTSSALSCTQLSCDEVVDAPSLNAKARFTVTAWPQASSDNGATGGLTP